MSCSRLRCASSNLSRLKRRHVVLQGHQSCRARCARATSFTRRLFCCTRHRRSWLTSSVTRASWHLADEEAVAVVDAVKFWERTKLTEAAAEKTHVVEGIDHARLFYALREGGKGRKQTAPATRACCGRVDTNGGRKPGSDVRVMESYLRWSTIHFAGGSAMVDAGSVICNATHERNWSRDGRRRKVDNSATPPFDSLRTPWSRG